MSYRGPEIIIIADGALGELESLLKEYDDLICVTDEQVHSQYSQILEDAIGKT